MNRTPATLFRALWPALGGAILLAACGGAAAPTSSTAGAPPAASGSAAAAAGKPAATSSPGAASAGLSSASAVGAASAPGALVKVRVRYPVVTPAWLPWVIAKDSKLFDKYGLDVDLDQLVPDQMMQAVISNQVEIGGLPPESVINADSRGASAVMLGAFIQKAIGRVTTVSSVNKIEDLKGKTAVVSGLGSLEDTSFKRLMVRAGLDPEKDISFVVVKDLPAELAAVKAGQAHAYLAIPPGELLGERAGLHVIFDVQSLNLPYSQASIFTTRAYLEKNRPTALALLQATTEALAKMKNEPAYALDTFIKYSKIEDKEIAQRGVDWGVDTLGRIPSVNEEALKAVLENVVKNNPAASSTDLKKVADTSLTDEIAKSDLLGKLYKN